MLHSADGKAEKLMPLKLGVGGWKKHFQALEKKQRDESCSTFLAVFQGRSEFQCAGFYMVSIGTLVP